MLQTHLKIRKSKSYFSNDKKRLSQNKLEMASVVSFQIEVIWISLKR